MNYNCPKCGSDCEIIPRYTDQYGNPTDASCISYCKKCDWNNED